MSDCLTAGIRVRVLPRYEAGRSQPSRGRWFFSYTIRIDNEGSRTVRLLRRHWVITDGAGRTEHIEGSGVVGETPVLAPGQHFTYTSFCPLPTSIGSMEGTYKMVHLDDGTVFDAVVAPFALVDPESEN